MTIKRYVAINNNTITNAYLDDLIQRATGSNMGLADSLEIFSIYAQASATSRETSRILIKFPVLTSDATASIQLDRTNGIIPVSGNVSFYLRLYNVKHPATLPRDYTVVVSPVSQSWQEGYGVDLDTYLDKTYDGTGSCWANAQAHVTWSSACEGGLNSTNGSGLEGGSYLSASWSGQPFTTYDEFNYTQFIGELGTDDLEIDITGLVEAQLGGVAIRGQTYSNYGVGIHITSSQENGIRSYYTKKFSGRGSEFVLKRPTIEARWDSTRRDNRGNFEVSSSNMNSLDNLMTLYLYNYVRGQPKNLAHDDGEITDQIYVNVYTSASKTDTDSTLCPHSNSVASAANCTVTGGWIAKGIYSASFALNTSASVVFDRWWSGSTADGLSTAADAIVYHTGSFKPQKFESSNIYSIPRYVTTITNLQPEYSLNTNTRLRLFTRLKDWSPTIYTVSSKEIRNHFVESAYYKVFRVIDNFNTVTYGTGSTNCTRLSYDATGSYFDFDMSMLEVGYEYGIKFLYYINGAYQEQPELFKFRITEE